MTENRGQAPKSLATKVLGVGAGVSIAAMVVGVADLVTGSLSLHKGPPPWPLTGRDVAVGILDYLILLGASFLGGVIAGSIVAERGSRYGLIVGGLLAFLLGAPPSLMEDFTVAAGLHVQGALEISAAILALAVWIGMVLLARKGAVMAVERSSPGDGRGLNRFSLRE